MTPARIQKSPALSNKISEMRLKLSPLVRITTGHVHPSFPKTLLHYWLLMDSQLDDLALFYHQRPEADGPEAGVKSRWASQYPKEMGWREGMGLEEKRRRWGKFIGLRGCETPKTERESRDLEDFMMMQVKIGRASCRERVF